MKSKQVLFIPIFLGILVVAKLLLRSEYLEQFSRVLNIVLICISAFFSFMILRIVIGKKKPVFNHKQLKIGWNLITLTLFYLALSELFSYIATLNDMVYTENVKMIFYLILLLGLLNIYNAFTRK